MSGTFPLTRRAFQAAAASLPLAGVALASEAAAQRRSSFDDGWRFSRGDAAGAQAPEFPDTGWRTLDVPHDWSIEGPFDKDAPGGPTTGYLPTGVGWYRKRFTLPSSSAGRRVLVQFDGVYQRSEVWLNGHSLGLRPNGYVSFVYDLTPFLNPPGRPNEIAVRVDNSLQPNSRWYSGSGIYRHVWLLTLARVHIAPWGVMVRTSDVTSDGAGLELTARVANPSDRPGPCRIDWTVRGPDGAVVATATASGAAAAAGEAALTARSKLDRPALWSPASPRLYSLETRLSVGGRLVDTDVTAFGVRDARFDADRGFLLNGERVKLNGVCVHHDGGCVGAAVPVAVWERRLGLLKQMGCNAIRTSHGPPDPEFLDLCDSMGFLVMDEAFDEWRQPKLQTPQYGYHHDFDEWAARDVAAMIERDRNHPCIVIWSAGNEVPDQTDPKGPETLQALLDIFHSMDPTRPVTVACDNIVAEPKAALPEFLSKLDVVGYNYPDRWRGRRESFYSEDRHAYPARKFVGAESTGIGGVRGVYRLQDDIAIFGEASGARQIAAEQLQKFTQTYDYVAGDFMWTGVDYLGEAFWPTRTAVSGVLDTCGFPKDSYYFYQSVWSRAPMLHLFPHWTWPGREGEVVPVTCYTNCDTAELFLNGRSLGVKGYAFPRPGMMERYGTYPPRAKALQTTADLHLSWDVVYAPGTLRAVGMKDGKVILTQEVATTGAPETIRLTLDRERVAASKGSAAHATVEILDSQGRLAPMADNEVVFALEGPGRILGLDNGRPDSHESFQSDRRKAFNGLALAVIGSDGRSGRLRLTAASPGLKGAAIELTAGK